MRKSLLAAGVALAFVCGAVVASAQDSAGTIGIRIVDAPTERSDDPRAKLYIVDHVAPGATVSRRVEVRNDTNTAQKIDTYAAAASVDNGEFKFGDDRAVNELTTWTTVDPPTDTYAVGDKKFVQVTIAVPEDASEGERYAVIWASVSSAAPSGGGITATNRVGVRIYLSVGPGGEPPSDFEITGMTAQRTKDGSPQVAARVKNTGGRALDLQGELSLKNGPGGLSAGPFNAVLGTTLGIGESEPVLVTLDKALPAGPWDSHITLKSGLTERSADATITFPKDAGASGTTVDPSSSSSNTPLIAGGVVALLVVLGAGVVLARRGRAGGGGGEETDPAPTP